MAKNLIIHSGHIEAFDKAIAEEQERLSQDFMHALQARMEELRMSQSDMAYTLGKSRAYISKLFTKGQNLTIKTMVELAHSLDMKVGLAARPLRPVAGGSQNTIPLQCKGWGPSRLVSISPTLVRMESKGGRPVRPGWAAEEPGNTPAQRQQIG